jgi:hypothetical protein
MTEGEIEMVAQLIFEKLIALQDDVERQYMYTSDNEAIIAEITALSLVKMDYIEVENYEGASEVQKKINKLRNELKK